MIIILILSNCMYFCWSLSGLPPSGVFLKYRKSESNRTFIKIIIFLFHEKFIISIIFIEDIGKQSHSFWLIGLFYEWKVGFNINLSNRLELFLPFSLILCNRRMLNFNFQFRKRRLTQLMLHLRIIKILFFLIFRLYYRLFPSFCNL